MQGPPKLLFLRDTVDRGLLQTYCSCVGISSTMNDLTTGAISLQNLFTKRTTQTQGISDQIKTQPGLRPDFRMEWKRHIIRQLPFLLEETFQQNPLRCQRSFQTFYSILCQPPLENQKAKKKVSGFIFPLNE